MRRRGFTLTELLAVISIITILMAVLIPSLHRARQQGYQVACAANLKTIGVAILYYVHDATNGNGFLPQLSTAEEIHMYPGNFWTNQIYPYLKFDPRLFRCLADRNPSQMFVTGPYSGHVATPHLHISHNRIREPTDTRQEAVIKEGKTAYLSYAGSCDTLVYIDRNNSRMVGRETRKLTDINTPHCTVLITCTFTKERYCWTWDQMVREVDSQHESVRMANRRHYGGIDEKKNGPNWLFADGHAEWRSLHYGVTTILCCQDLGNSHPIYDRALLSRDEQSKACYGKKINLPDARRGR